MSIYRLLTDSWQPSHLDSHPGSISLHLSKTVTCIRTHYCALKRSQYKGGELELGNANSIHTIPDHSPGDFNTVMSLASCWLLMHLLVLAKLSAQTNFPFILGKWKVVLWQCSVIVLRDEPWHRSQAAFYWDPLCKLSSDKINWCWGQREKVREQRARKFECLTWGEGEGASNKEREGDDQRGEQSYEWRMTLKGAGKEQVNILKTDR